MTYLFQKQMFRHDPDNGQYGDCGRTVVACLLGLPVEEVPHEHRPMTGDEYNALMDAFLKSKGVSRIWLAFNAETPQQAVEFATIWSNGMHFVLLGKSPRGTNHVVIGHDGKIVHDPHPDGGDLVGPSDNGFYYVEWLVRPLEGK
jgi:hypothetical protein